MATMTELASMKCEACRAESPRATAEEINSYIAEIPDWKTVEYEGVLHLERRYKVKDFATALELTNKIGTLAEQEGHHPAITLQWGVVDVAWWTHAIRGLHRNDFIMAAKTEELFKALKK
jgi:4a-hydroxytetrahydrobiopterin dehydratase